MDCPQIGPKNAIKLGEKRQKDKWYLFRAPTCRGWPNFQERKGHINLRKSRHTGRVSLGHPAGQTGVFRRPRRPDNQVTGRNQVSTTFCFSAVFWSFPPKGKLGEFSLRGTIFPLRDNFPLGIAFPFPRNGLFSQEMKGLIKRNVYGLGEN